MAPQRIGLLVLLVGVLVVVGLQLGSGGRDAREVLPTLVESEGEREVFAAEPEAALDVETESERMPAESKPVELPELPELSENGDWDLGEGAPPGKVALRVRVHGPDGALAGVDVRAQSWLEDTEETFHHEETTDPQGMAVFTFSGFTHVDWLFCSPPPESGLGATLVDYHQDIRAGYVMDAWIDVLPAGSVVGRVEYEDGTPASGIEVHAYLDYFLADLDADWRPGIFTAVTALDGSYVFPRLPARVWYVGVPPFEWLQLLPDLTEAGSGTYAELEQETEVDLGVIRIAPLHRLDVRVVGAEDAPIPQLTAMVRPIDFGASAIALSREDEDEPSPLVRWLRGKDPFGSELEDLGPTTPWVYEEGARMIDETGRASFPLVAGTWELTLFPSHGVPTDESIVHREVLLVPSPEVVVTVDATSGAVLGRLIDSGGRPVAGARVILNSSGGRHSRAWKENTDGSGRFEFTGLTAQGEYELSVNHHLYLPDVWRAKPSKEVRDYVLRPAASLRIRFVDTSGAAVSRTTAKILSAVPHTSRRALSEADQAHLDRLVTGGDRRPSDRNGLLTISRLIPGTYEIGVELPFATGRVDSRGYVLTEPRVWARWKLSTGEDRHELTLDLGGYERPRTPHAEHTGKLTDAGTGRALAAEIRVVRPGLIQNTWSNAEDGSFGLHVPAGEGEVLFLRAGFVPQRIPSRSWPEGSYEHRVELVPDDSAVTLRVTDRLGEPLRGYRVELMDTAGQELMAFFGGGHNWRSGWNVEQGDVQIAGLARGEVRVRVKLFDLDVGTYPIQVRGSSPAETIVLSVEKSEDELREWMREILAQGYTGD